MGSLGEFAPQLKVLDLSHNRLISLEGLSACYSLKKLNLSYNYVADDQLKHLINLIKLKKIDLSHN